MDSPTQIIRVNEAARRLGVTRRTISNWLKENPDFPRKIRVGPSVVGFVEAELEAYIQSRREG